MLFLQIDWPEPAEGPNRASGDIPHRSRENPVSISAIRARMAA
jgi:hypothetical protein